MIKAVIFDWSGVLCDDTIPVYETVMQVIKYFGAKRITLEEFNQKYDLPYMKFYSKIVPGVKKEDLDDKYMEFYAKTKNKSKPIKYVNETLEWFKQNNIGIAILSSQAESFIKKEMHEFGYPEILIIRHAHNKKNDVNEIVNQLHDKKDEVIFVGDMTHDIETGKHAGVKTAAVLTGYQSREKLEKAKPDYVFSDLRDLKKVVEDA